MHNMEYYHRTEHGLTVEHGNQGRVTNPSLAGDVQITASQCNRLYLILVLLHKKVCSMYMYIPGSGTSIETVFYVALSRLKARGVKRRGPVTRFGLKLD